jgi:hypothetical protein
VVTTDLTMLPREMHENFPKVEYEKCFDAATIQSPVGFGLQASPGMAMRCSTENWRMSNGTLAYTFQCDGGATLTGDATGSYTAQRVSLHLRSHPRPVVREIHRIDQRLTASRKGPC